MGKLSEESLWEGIKSKIQKFISNIQRISEIFLQKSKKYHNKDTNRSPDMFDISKSIKFDSALEGSKL